MKDGTKTTDLIVDPLNLRLVVIARAAIVLLLAYATAVWTSGGPAFPEQGGIPTGLGIFLITALLLSVVYYILLEFAPNVELQTLVQMVLDVFLVTWLLWQTGDATSPYFPLYVLLIGVSGSLLNANSTVFISAFSGFCYTVLSLLVSQSVVYSFSGSEPPSRIVQIIALNDVALLVVGLLAARLSERRRIKRELQETTANFEDLTVLHQRILQSVRSGLITCDLEGGIREFNQAAEKITGYRKDRMVGGSIYDLFGDEIRPQIQLCIQPPESEGFMPDHFEAAIRRNGKSGPQGRTAVVVSPVPLTTRTGEKYGLILSFQDVTKIRSMEESLRTADRLAAVGRMAAGLAHEIRNPLGSMGSAVEYLQGKLEPASPEESVLKVVQKESERLNRIITDFLEYARPREAIREKIDIRRPIEETITLLNIGPETDDARSIEFARPDEPVFITVDEEKLKQVFWNLLRNSLVAIGEGGTVVVTIDELKGSWVRVTVEDDGTGMDDETLSHIFEPFSTGSSGTGLGLPIAHKIILEHGGRMDVFSRKDEGTRVLIELPQ